MKGIKVMIVDDEQEFAKTVAERLQLRHFETAVAAGGEEALALLGNSSPDVILLDLKMPDMSGLEVLDKIKAHDPSVEVIMLTGHDSTASGIDGMERGAFDYIVKPVDLSELILKIGQASQKRKSSLQKPHRS